jgi:hypothetical protein
MLASHPLRRAVGCWSEPGPCAGARPSPPPPLPLCSFQWRENCNKCGAAKAEDAETVTATVVGGGNSQPVSREGEGRSQTAHAAHTPRQGFNRATCVGSGSGSRFGSKSHSGATGKLFCSPGPVRRPPPHRTAVSTGWVLVTREAGPWFAPSNKPPNHPYRDPTKSFSWG